MLQLLVVACVFALGAADPEMEAAEAASPVYLHHDERDFKHRHHDHESDHLHGLKKVHVSEDVLSKQYKIIEHVYSPDYHEPTLVLDFRYLKSGGREYTRGPGGQILILPHGVHSDEHQEHKDYDSLIEFLRLRHKAQTEAQIQRHVDGIYDHHGHHSHKRDDHDHEKKVGPEVRRWT